MTEREAFLAKIVAEPDEDTHRVAFADWLEENGGGYRDAERAEFIRVQCELYRKERTPFPPGEQCTCLLTPESRRAYQHGIFCEACTRRMAPITALRVREQELLIGSITTAHSPIPGWAVFNAPSRNFILSPWSINGIARRGFIPEITCTAADFLTHADALLWSPRQTTSCAGRCSGTGQRTIWAAPNSRKVKTITCPECRGRGRLPRPCPPTAQPIRGITLTTRLEWVVRSFDTGKKGDRFLYLHAGEFEAGSHRRCRWASADRVVESRSVAPLVEILAEEWPGVSFNFLRPDTA